MKLPRPRRWRQVSRGQALVEMAIILPILALLLLLALDFGRVFFGWVSLQNAVRIGANEAAAHPTKWIAGGSDQLYYTKMAQDLQAINCNADFDGDGDIDSNDLPAPVFEDPSDPLAYAYDNGDEVTVTLQCDMSFLTPLVGNLIGNPLRIEATSTFAVFGAIIEGVPPPPDPIPAGCIGVDKQVPDLVGRTISAARQAWTDAGFTGSFNPSTGSDTDIVDTQTTTPVSSPGNCVVYTATVTVTHSPVATCTGTDVNVPDLVGMTVLDARTLWTGTFTGAFTPASGSGTDVVSAQTTSPVSNVGDCVPLTAQVTVTHAPPVTPPGTCLMTQVLGFTPAAAQSAYQTQGFTGAFSTKPANKPTWKVKTQSLIGGQTYACTASLEVDLENK